MHENYKKKCNTRSTVTKSIYSAHCCKVWDCSGMTDLYEGGSRMTDLC